MRVQHAHIESRWFSDQRLSQTHKLCEQLTSSLCLALSELGEGKSSSEKRLGVRLLASSIIGSSSACSSGSLSASDGEMRALKLEFCFSILVQLY